MGGESKGELDRLRLRAGGMGITIKTHGANRISRRRTYSLIDRTTGTVLHRDIDGVADLEARLARIGRDRQRPRADGPPEEEELSSCPSCGTRRIGQFRWCTSCGHDFEPTLHGGALWSRSGFPEPDATATSTERSGDVRLPPLVPGAPEHRGLDPVLGRDRSRRVGIPFWDRDVFLSAREIGIGAVLGLLVGVITTVLLSRR